MYQLVDTHAHLDEIEDLEPVLAGAKKAGLTAIVAVGSDLESNRKVLELAARHEKFVYPALGWHPWFIKEGDIDKNLEFIRSHVHEAVAIGEVGLDYHKRVRAVADKELQKRVLGEILQIAKAHDKPVSIHSRYAWRDAYDAAANAGLEKAVFHWYTGTSSVLRDIIESGYYISVTPAVEYHEEHRRAVKEAPLKRMLLETDSPVVYQRGTENEFTSSPADVLRSLREAAVLKGVSEEELADITTRNAVGLFGL
ncbi:MAG: TatD family hydrolase [Dehalococcoidales bacterium]|nr:TatD family hydrolase [Dehalococcoidales bacterium]